MSSELDPGQLRFSPDTGLIPAVVQDASDGTVLMLGYMDREAVDRTRETRRVTFFSRSRNRLWEKGETSGHTLRLVSMVMDCDGDALLVRADPVGPTCHTGARSCFESTPVSVAPASALGDVLARLEAVIDQRAAEMPAGSYTASLLASGVLRTAQKVVEEAAETALAAAAQPERLVEESADLLYHLLVLWRSAGLDAQRVADELAGRGA
jgi:phosphoribosyl-ATP pyrophosphohydrolase/phosphoribosyl-AMP cyclohydrolase